MQLSSKEFLMITYSYSIFKLTYVFQLTGEVEKLFCKILHNFLLQTEAIFIK